MEGREISNEEIEATLLGLPASHNKMSQKYIL